MIILLQASSDKFYYHITYTKMGNFWSLLRRIRRKLRATNLVGTKKIQNTIKLRTYFLNNNVTIQREYRRIGYKNLSE